MILIHTAVETAVSDMQKLLLTGEVPTSLTVLFCLAMADGLFRLYGSELWPGRAIYTHKNPKPDPHSSGAV